MGRARLEATPTCTTAQVHTSLASRAEVRAPQVATAEVRAPQVAGARVCAPQVALARVRAPLVALALCAGLALSCERPSPPPAQARDAGPQVADAADVGTFASEAPSLPLRARAVTLAERLEGTHRVEVRANPQKPGRWAFAEFGFEVTQPEDIEALIQAIGPAQEPARDCPRCTPALSLTFHGPGGPQSRLLLFCVEVDTPLVRAPFEEGCWSAQHPGPLTALLRRVGKAPEPPPESSQADAGLTPDDLDAGIPRDLADARAAVPPAADAAQARSALDASGALAPTDPMPAAPRGDDGPPDAAPDAP